MAPGTHRFHSQLGETATWGYGGAPYLGPTIEAARGAPVAFLARNRLGPHLLGVDTALHGPNMADDAVAPRASLHLNGGNSEPGSDGYPEDTFLQGTDHPYRYENDQAAGTVWYHDHALGITRLNVYAGLAGFYLVRGETDALLPSGPHEIPIVIQDKRLHIDVASGTNPLAYPNPWAPEFFGDIAVINGAAWPYLEVARGWYRLRLLNGSSSRFLPPGARSASPHAPGRHRHRISRAAGRPAGPGARAGRACRRPRALHAVRSRCPGSPAESAPTGWRREPRGDRAAGASRVPGDEGEGLAEEYPACAGRLRTPSTGRSEHAAGGAPDGDHRPRNGRACDGPPQCPSLGHRRGRAPRGRHARGVGDRQPHRRYASDPPAPDPVPAARSTPDGRRFLPARRVRHGGAPPRRRGGRDPSPSRPRTTMSPGPLPGQRAGSRVGRTRCRRIRER